MTSQANYTVNSLVSLIMRTPTIPERIDAIKDALCLTSDVEFARLAGMFKSVLNQLYIGKIKSFSARYAYKLEENTGFCAKWIQLGEGPDRVVIGESFKSLTPDERELLSGYRSAGSERKEDMLAVARKALFQQRAVNE